MNIKKYLPIFIILIIIASLAVGYFLTWPKYEEFVFVRKDFEVKDEQLKEKLKYSSELDIISASLKQRSEELAQIDVALPLEPSIAALYYFVKDIDARSKLKFEDINISSLFTSQRKVSVMDSAYKMPFSTSMSGGYSQFKDFLINLYLNSRIIKIKSLNFSADSESNNLYDFELKLETQKYNPNIQNVVNYQEGAM
jgi:Tfp pilus assembly protein PilO